MVNKDFLKAVLRGEKQLLKKAEVKFIEVPHYEELSVKKMYPLMAKDPQFMSLFPDKYPIGKAPPRDYFFNILHTLHADYLQQCIAHATKQRVSSEGVAMKDATIRMSEYWSEQLDAMPYLSRKYRLISFVLIRSFLF